MSSTESGHDRATIRAPRGPTISAKGGSKRRALRMLHNNLDPEVTEPFPAEPPPFTEPADPNTLASLVNDGR